MTIFLEALFQELAILAGSTSPLNGGLETFPFVVLSWGELQSGLTWMTKMVVMPFGRFRLERLRDQNLAILSH